MKMASRTLVNVSEHFSEMLWSASEKGHMVPGWLTKISDLYILIYMVLGNDWILKYRGNNAFNG